MEKIHFTSQGQNIDGTLFIPDKKKKSPGVIFFHGLTSDQDKYILMAEKLVEQGISAMTLNLRGHGTSEGELSSLTMMDNIDDALIAYDFFIKQEGVDSRKIGIFGSSYGCVLASILSEQRNVQSLFLRAPATYTNKMMKTNFDIILADEKRVFHTLPDIKNTAIVQAISKFKGNLFITASENDEIVPVSIPEVLFKEANLAKRKKMELIKDATHRLTERQLQELTDTLEGWFLETL